MDTIKPTKADFARISKPSPETVEYIVEGMDGLRVRVGARGQLSFSVLIRVGGKRKRIPIKPVELTKNSLRAAIVEARDSAELTADLGDKTLRSLGEKIIEDANVAESTRRNQKGHLEHLVQVFNNRLTDDAGTIFDAHRQLTRDPNVGPVAANNCIKTYRRIINVAGAAYNVKLKWPTQKIATLKMWNEERPREGRAGFNQMGAIWEACFEMPEPWGRMLQAYFLTGLRNTELVKGVVVDDDFVVVDTKNKKTHRLPMTPQMRVLMSRPFVSESTGNVVTNGRPIGEYLERLTGIHLTRHDIRRTFATVANDVGCTEHTIKMLMNHKKVDVTGNYMGRVRDTLEVSLLKIADRYAELTQSPKAEDQDEDERLRRELAERRRRSLKQTRVVIGSPE